MYILENASSPSMLCKLNCMAYKCIRDLIAYSRHLCILALAVGTDGMHYYNFYCSTIQEMQRFEPIQPAIRYHRISTTSVGLRCLLQVCDNEMFHPEAKIRWKKGAICTQRLRSDPLPFDLRASSTSTLLYISPYPLRTVLGVALPAISLLFLSINSLARCRSADSRFNRAPS